LTHNIGQKALSLALAAVIWLFVTAEKEAEIGVEVQVGVKNLAPGLVIANQLPPRIDVRLAGPKIALLRLHTVRPVLLLDLQGAREGATGFPGLDRSIPLPAGVRVTRVTPATIEVRLARAGSAGN
jgi:hypothetical protein